MDRHKIKRLAERQKVFVINRTIIGVIVVTSIGMLCWTPPSVPWYVFDVLIRSYLGFLGTVMAHEGVHGHLGQSRASNFWLGKLALIPTMVPFTNFRKTHHLHHRHTNDPSRDPDHFMAPRFSKLELPFRAVAMPHQWIFWLYRRNKIKRADLIDLLLNYLIILAVYIPLTVFVGVERILSGMTPSLFLVSLILWYPFAFRTHEGFSIGSQESRSHNYYGHLMYWFSLGLSMHREHHMKPGLSWIELRPFVKKAPDHTRRFLIKRDIHRDARI